MDPNTIKVIGLILAVILTLWQEIRHYLNHNTIAPDPVRPELHIHKLEKIVSEINQRLENYQLEIKLMPKS